MWSTPIKHSVLNVKAVVAAFDQEKALVGAFSVITNFRMDLLEEPTEHWLLYQWHTTYSLQSGNNVTVWTLGWETCTWDHQDQRFTLDTFSQYAAHSSLFYPSKELGFTMNTHIVHQGPTRQFPLENVW